MLVFTPCCRCKSSSSSECTPAFVEAAVEWAHRYERFSLSWRAVCGDSFLFYSSTTHPGRVHACIPRHRAQTLRKRRAPIPVKTSLFAYS